MYAVKLFPDSQTDYGVFDGTAWDRAATGLPWSSRDYGAADLRARKLNYPQYIAQERFPDVWGVWNAHEGRWLKTASGNPYWPPMSGAMYAADVLNRAQR